MRIHGFRVLILALILSLTLSSAAFAFDYKGGQGNPATFETLEEARISGPIAVQSLETNETKKFVSHALLDNYPEGTTFIYRSAELFGGRAAARLNTNLLVFTEQSFAGKDEALAYLKSLGVIDIIDKAVGTVVLVTPANPETGFTSASDRQNFYALLLSMLSQKASVKIGEETIFYSDAEYFGGRGYTYVIGIDGGATFLNNFVVGVTDYVSRIAGLLLINGDMAPISQIATKVPVYLVNPKDSVIEKYKKINDTDAYSREGNVEIYYDQQFPVKQVRVLYEENADVAKCIERAYYDMFINALRVRIINQGNLTETPYSLFPRNPLFDIVTEKDRAIVSGVTRDGIHMNRVDSEIFSDIKTENGDYLNTWYEYIPEEVLNGSVTPGSVPLIISMHGSGDDPRLFVDHNGFLNLMGKERFVVVAPEHQYIAATRSEALPKLAQHLLEKYPALDASRVYISGYSMGGGATQAAIHGNPAIFAAAVPMAAGSYEGTPEQIAQFETVDLPVMITTSTFDFTNFFDQANSILSERLQKMLRSYCSYNELKPLGELDFEAYPYVGFKADKYDVTINNGDYKNHAWYLYNDQGIPMVAVNITENLTHGIYPGQAEIAWNFMKHYSRDLETGAVVYDPYAQ